MKLEIIMTDAADTGPDGWRHVEVTGTAASEAEARAAAEAAKMMFLGDSYELMFRTAFEYRYARVNEWHLYGRFSFRK